MISQNRVALVTGSSSGIGSAVANAFASSGYNLVINYSSSAERAKETLANCEKLGSEAVSVRCDVSIQALSGETALISMDNIDMENTVMQKFGIKTAFKHCFHRRV